MVGILSICIPQLLHAQPVQIGAGQSVAPARRDIGDGICLTVAHSKDLAPAQVPFPGVDDALGLLNRSSTRLTEDGRVSTTYSLINFKNNDPVAIGDFDGDALFPFSDNPGASPPGNDRSFAVRARGYINVGDASLLKRTIGMYADDGARLTIGGALITVPDIDQRLSSRRIRQIQYGNSGLYPIELIYYQNGSLAVLELSETNQWIPENIKITNLQDIGFNLVGEPRRNLFANTELYTTRVVGVPLCIECSVDASCPAGNYCVKDWGPTPPEGLCQQCNVTDHCGADCKACLAGTPICSPSGCVQCLVNTDCPIDNLCEGATHSCQPIVPNWEYLGGCSAVPSTSGATRPGSLPLGLLAVMGTMLAALFLRRKRLSSPGKRLGLVLLCLLVLLPGAAWADLSANTQTFHPALGADNIVTVEGTRIGKPLRPFFNILLDYAHRPLRLVDGDTGQILANTVPDTLTLHLMAGFSITRWLALAADLPVVVYQGFDSATPVQDISSAPNSYGLADFRLVAKVRFINNDKGGVGLAFVPQVTFPTGDARQLRSDDAYGIEPRLALDYRTPGGAIIALNAGFLGRTSNQILRGMEVGSQVRYGLGMLVPLAEGFGLLGEVAGGVSVNNLANGNLYAPLEGNVGGRWVHASGLNVNLGAGMGFTSAVGSPQFHLFAGIGYLPITRKPVGAVTKPQSPPPSTAHLLAEKSGSGTGLVTSWPAGIDCGSHCSADFRLGTQLALKAQPGPDSHLVGWAGPCSGTQDCLVTLNSDTRVGIEFARNEELRTTITIDKEGEGEGLVSSDPPGIACGTACSASFRQDQEVRLTAVPEKDSRFSGWGGPCTGVETCTLIARDAPHVKAKFIKSHIAITETKLDLQGNVIHFETAKSNIDIDSFRLLDEVALIMKQHPKMQLRIEGHTDSVPFYAPGGNLQLSKDRAASVVQYLIRNDVTGARLDSQGFGDTCPVSSNLSSEGRQENRRTEFLIVDPKTGKFERTHCVGYTAAPKPYPRRAPIAPKKIPATIGK